MQVRLLFLLVSFLLSVNASSWKVGSEKIYNKWHETELEKWLSDHHVPYPKPAERKDLVDAVEKHWDQVTTKLEDYAHNTADSVKSWIFDTWTDSALKSWLDYHKIPSPQFQTRDALLTAARGAYSSVADAAKNVAGIPGHWIYASWSESELKAWLDTHGVPVPQGSKRNEMIALVRRNIHRVTLEAQRQEEHLKGAQKVFQAGKEKAADIVYTMADSAADTVRNAAGTLSEKMFETWSDSQLKAWADKNGIPVPQGSKRNEVIALIRQAQVGDESLRDSAYSMYEQARDAAVNAYDAVTSKVNEKWSQGNEEFDKIISAWSDSQLKAYLDAHGIPVPQKGKRDELLAAVRRNKHKANVALASQSFFNGWNSEQLFSWLQEHGISIPKSGSRNDLVNAAKENYASASSVGGETFKTLSIKAAQVTNTAFEKWTDSDLKVTLPEGSTREAILAKAQGIKDQTSQWTSKSSGYDILSKAQDCLHQIVEQIKGALRGASGAAYGEAEKAADYVKENVHAAEHRAAEQAEKVTHQIKEEL